HLRIYSIWAALLSEAKEFEKALDIVDNALKLSPQNIGLLADKARILRCLNRDKEVKQIDSKIIQVSKGDLTSQDVKDIYIAANYFAVNDNYKTAGDLLATFVDTENNNQYTLQLADFFARSGRKAKALLIYENLRKKFGVSKDYTRHEVEIYYF